MSAWLGFLSFIEKILPFLGWNSGHAGSEERQAIKLSSIFLYSAFGHSPRFR
jgi:hypothetical protein